MRRITLTLLATVAVFLATVSPGVGGEIVVSAAASLTNAFREIGKAFESSNPGVAVTLNIAASGALLQQLEQGAPIDVFASADQETLDRAEAKGLIRAGTRRVFAKNSLVLVAPKRIPGMIRSIGDLNADSVQRIAMGDPSFVPAGRYARQALAVAGLWEGLQSKLIFANSVRQVLDYVARGEVDAAFVYATDAALRADSVRVVGPAAGHGPILYPVAVTTDSEHSKTAESFLEFILNPDGRAILESFGFQSP